MVLFVVIWQLETFEFLHDLFKKALPSKKNQKQKAQIIGLLLYLLPWSSCEIRSLKVVGNEN
jgi:hypothetical protein